MEKYLKLSEVMEELERLIRTNQIEPIHVSLMNLEEIFTKMSNPLEHLVRRGVSQPMKFAEGYNIIDIGNTDDFNTPELTIPSLEVNKSSIILGSDKKLYKMRECQETEKKPQVSTTFNNEKLNSL